MCGAFAYWGTSTTPGQRRRNNPSNWGHHDDLERRIPQVPPRIHHDPGRVTNLDGRDPTPSLPRIEEDQTKIRPTPSSRRSCIEVQDGRDPTPPLSYIGDGRDGTGSSVGLGSPFDTNLGSIVFGDTTAGPGPAIGIDTWGNGDTVSVSFGYGGLPSSNLG